MPEISWLPPWLQEGVTPFLAVLVVVGGGVLMLLNPEFKTEVMVLITMVVSFYFGSSKGSQAKDDTIKKQLEREVQDNKKRS